MKSNKFSLLAILSTLATLLLASCNYLPNSPEEEEEKVYEIGDTVKEWSYRGDYDEAPLNVKESSDGIVTITDEIGNEDNTALECTITGDYIGSDTLEKPYFNDEDAKNGDIISLYFYLPKDNNVKSLKLEALGSGNFVQSQWGGSSGDTIEGNEILVNEEKEEKWIRTKLSYDTLETLGAIRLNVTRNDTTKPAHFFVDNINVLFGEETVKHGYEYKDERLCKAF